MREQGVFCLKKKYSITGIDCANCAAKLESKMNELPQVEDVVLTFATQQLLVVAENPDEVLPELQQLADKMEPGTKIGPLSRKRNTGSGSHGHEHHHEHGGQEHEHHHDHEHCGHEHHHHHHADDIFISWGTETPHKYAKSEIEQILKTLSEDDTYGEVLRAKGMVENTESGWIYFDMTPGEYDIREGEPEYTGRLCVIGTNIEEAKLKELFGIG